jgi:acyl-CoA dehydrogenase
MSQNESMIAEAIDRILADAKTGSASADAGTWRTLADAGVLRLLRPEAEGGAGPAWRDAAEVLQAAGRHGATVGPGRCAGGPCAALAGWDRAG